MVHWLITEKSSIDLPLHDFKQLCYEIRPGDVILVEGRSRISDVIKLITQSPWTHAALYIGHQWEIKDPELRQRVQEKYHGATESPLIIEALLGEGTVVHAIDKYKDDHVRICRPTGITPQDSQKVISYAISRLGSAYHVRQLLDLARFLFPYSLLPRRWRSSLFMHNAGFATHTVCSTMLSEAFQRIKFPILPVTEKTPEGKVNFYMRNPRLVTPKDFDYSPYFEIIKYPIFGFDRVAMYQKLPWNKEGLVCHEPGNCYMPSEFHSTKIGTVHELSKRGSHHFNLLKHQHLYYPQKRHETQEREYYSNFYKKLCRLKSTKRSHFFIAVRALWNSMTQQHQKSSHTSQS